MSARALHCWAGRKEEIEERYGYNSPEHLATYDDGWKNGTCLLPSGHDGPHDFTDDDQITVQFQALP